MNHQYKTLWKNLLCFVNDEERDISSISYFQMISRTIKIKSLNENIIYTDDIKVSYNGYFKINKW